MTVYHGEENWEVEILKIYKKVLYKPFFRQKIQVSGKAKVLTDADNGFIILDFVYTGSPGEDPKRLYDYIRARAVTVRYNNRNKEENTLENHLEELMDK